MKKAILGTVMILAMVAGVSATGNEKVPAGKTNAACCDMNECCSTGAETNENCCTEDCCS